jgi:hypothetical protein
MIIYRPTWDGWVHLLALRHGQVLSERETGWLLWERTAYPMTTDLVYLGRQVHEALEQPMDDEEFMDAQDPEKREADRLATELGHVTRERDALVVENARLEETVAGWRAENDRHRHLYVEAERARQDAVAERDRLRAVVDALRVLVEEAGPWPAADLGTEQYNRLMVTLTQLDYHEGDRTKVGEDT